jgi:hypothetical protein
MLSNSADSHTEIAQVTFSRDISTAATAR